MLYDRKLKLVGERLLKKGKARADIFSNNNHITELSIGSKVVIKAQRYSDKEDKLTRTFLEVYEGRHIVGKKYPINSNKHVFSKKKPC